MSLDQKDVQTIRNVFAEGLEELVLPRLDGIESRQEFAERQMKVLKNETELGLGRLHLRVGKLNDLMEMIDADIKEIYAMIKPERDGPDKPSKQILEAKIKQAHSNILHIAEQAGVTLSH